MTKESVKVGTGPDAPRFLGASAPTDVCIGSIDTLLEGQVPKNILDTFGLVIVDEAHRLMPGSTRTINPANLEFLRDIHDQTGCGLALLATARFQAALEKGEYQYEQLIGRIGMPIRLPKQIKRRDTMQIIQQFLPDPSSDTIAKSMEIANAPGRLGILVETLKVASRIASKAGDPLSDEHFTKAIAIRTQMMTGH
jgi:DNA transposition AAA+ family ATPase